jgi:hypothetical protein
MNDLQTIKTRFFGFTDRFGPKNGPPMVASVCRICYKKVMIICRQRVVLCLALLTAIAGSCPAAPAANPLQDAVILIIRHAEKPKTGPELTPAGMQRADAYVNYFKNYQIDSQPLKLDYIFAAADSKNSHRPRLTLTPLSQALQMPLDTRFSDKNPQGLAGELQSKSHGKHILICWRHESIPGLLRALGADPAALIPDNQWPDSVYDWLIQLRYDHDGRLMAGKCKLINEHLMPGDSTTPEP